MSPWCQIFLAACLMVKPRKKPLPMSGMQFQLGLSRPGKRGMSSPRPPAGKLFVPNVIPPYRANSAATSALAETCSTTPYQPRPL